MNDTNTEIPPGTSAPRLPQLDDARNSTSCAAACFRSTPEAAFSFQNKTDLCGLRSVFHFSKLAKKKRSLLIHGRSIKNQGKMLK